MYTISYSGGGTWVDVPGVEVKMRLPDQPPLSKMRNFGLREEDQKFKREITPKDLHIRAPKDIEAFVSAQWHQRRNGDWWLIKGQPIYITGPAWVFLNYWEMESGGLPDFRIEAVHFFWVWHHVITSPRLFGMFDVKCRRLGDTEKALFCGWEMVTRYRNSKMGIQSMSDVDAGLAYTRAVVANKAMPFWFRPMNQGMDDPKKALVFRYASRSATAAIEDKGQEQDREDVKELGSSIDFRATKARMYDGQRLRMYLLDEIGKIPPQVMSGNFQWGIARQCLSMHNETVIVGKAILPTTIEDISNGATVEECAQLWKDSDPRTLTARGGTTSGLLRVFRGYEYAAEVDEYGFHLVEQARVARQAQIEAYIASGNLDMLSAYMRKVPETIEESLAVPATDCVLLPALLDQQIAKMRNPDFVAALAEPPVTGDLMWTNGFFSAVKFVPNPVGKWTICQMPENPNAKTFFGGVTAPGNVGQVHIGLDTYDHAGSSGSDGAIAIFRPYNPMAEHRLRFHGEDGGEMEIMNKQDMATEKWVACYRGRPYNPEHFYEEALKACVFWGSQMLSESNKPGVLHYFERVGAKAYKAKKPGILGIGAKGPVDGMASSVPSIEAYVALLKTYVSTYVQNCALLPILYDFRNFTGDNRTKCDLMVAAGFSLLSAQAQALVTARKGRQGTSFGSAFKTYR